MYKIADKSELNQISLTGVRAITLLGLLISRPMSLEEIRKTFIELNIMEEDNSDDILRIDINTLKSMGCQISRCCAKTNHKYVLLKHPFSFNITESELNAIKKVYSHIKQTANIELLFRYDELFRKISAYVCDNQTKEAFLGISALKYINITLIKDLMIDCRQNRTLELLYKKANAKAPSKKQILAQKLVFQNDKIYLYGYDFDKQEAVMLNVRRINSILSRKIQKDEIQQKSVKIKFILDGILSKNLQEDETIIEQGDVKSIIEGNYHNDFIAMQRILSFGAKCTVLEPAEFKNVIINKLKEMRENYEC